ncbi:MAG: hypothetical protein E7604_04700 [Ruminococcaceae bacterium]|nr:hypothetical protein [Oscillospiraceae bacterium]
MSNDFDLDRQIKKMTAQLTKDIRQKSEKAAVAREYDDHIHDAMQNYMLGGMTEEDAFSEVCEDLGDIDEIAATLGDIHNQDKIPADVRRENILRWSIIGVVSVTLYGLLLWAWDIFVLQMTILIVGIILAINLIILSLAYHKRRRAMKSIRRYAKENGFRIQANRTVYTSILYAADKPSVILENDTQYIKVRFLATLHKNRVLHFLGRNVYTMSARVGMLAMATPFGVGFHAPPWRRFLPWSGRTLEIAEEYAVDAIALPTLERRHDPHEKEVHEVLIFNPAPMRAFYREGTTEVELLGGEQKDGVWLHDIVSFGTMLRKLKGDF